MASDLYLFFHVNGCIQCCGCRLGDDWDFHSGQEVHDHIQEHVKAGHVVRPDIAGYTAEDWQVEFEISNMEGEEWK